MGPKKPPARHEQDAKVEANAGLASLAGPEVSAAENSAGDQQVLEAIQTLKRELLDKIEEKATETQIEVRNAIGLINQRLDETENRTAELESGVNAHSDAIAALESDMSHLKKEMLSLKAKCEDLEGRSRRCNVRITGIKEGRENGRQPSQFVADLLKDALSLEKPPCLERAHRTLRTRPQDDLPPRAFVVQFHYFTEKESLLKKASVVGMITTSDGDRIRVLPDYTQAVSKQRAAFSEVRNLLRGCTGVRYGLRYPATLRISTTDGQEHTFKDPKPAKDFVLKELLKA